jgi:hypothetical protein
MESINKFWSKTMEIPGAGWIVAFSGLVICVAVAYYVLMLLRDMATGKTVEPTSYIGDFQKLRDEGKLNDEEYTKLAKSIPTVISDGVDDNRIDELPDFEEQPEPAD